jgi:hypothetical protein
VLRHLMIRWIQYKPTQASSTKRNPLWFVLVYSCVASYDDYLDFYKRERFDPFDIRCFCCKVISQVNRIVSTVLQESIESFSKDRRSTIVKKYSHAARASSCSKLTARRTEAVGTRHTIAAPSTDPSLIAASDKIRVGMPVASSTGCPNDLVGSTTIPTDLLAGHHRAGTPSSKSRFRKLGSTMRLKAYCFRKRSIRLSSPVSSTRCKKTVMPSVLSRAVDSGRSSFTMLRAISIACRTFWGERPASMKPAATRASIRSLKPR